jgi:homoserine kinase type II
VAWLPLVHTCQARADEVESGLAEELAEAAVRILREWPANLPRGQIHADLFPDNVFFLDGRLSGLIDFYFACTEYFAFDIAVCLNAWCFEPGFMFNASHARALLAGYNSVRPLEDKELSALPVLAQGAALRFLLTRLYDWLHMPPGAIVTPKNPLEYLHLTAKPGPTIRSPSGYGPTEDASPILDQADGRRCCVTRAMSGKFSVPNRRPPITAWN